MYYIDKIGIAVYLQTGGALSVSSALPLPPHLHFLLEYNPYFFREYCFFYFLAISSLILYKV